MKFSKAQIQKARNKVSADWAEIHLEIHREDLYASHVTQEEKDANLEAGLKNSREIKEGLHDNNFTIWQRIHLELTGECVPLLP